MLKLAIRAHFMLTANVDVLVNGARDEVGHGVTITDHAVKKVLDNSHVGCKVIPTSPYRSTYPKI